MLKRADCVPRVSALRTSLFALRILSPSHNQDPRHTDLRKAFDGMYRQPRRLSLILKCRFCRRDKRKCFPPDRVWPDQKCVACVRYGYDCSNGLSAKDEWAENELNEQSRIDRHLSVANPPFSHRSRDGVQINTVIDTSPDSDSRDTSVVEPQRALQEFEVINEDDAGTDASQFTAQRAIQPSGVYEHGDSTENLPHCSLTIHRPSRSSGTTNITVRLEEMLLQVWANPDIYREICSLRLGTTTAELFIHSRQLAESYDTVFSSLFAFCAASSSIYVDQPVALELEAASRQYLGHALKLLKTRLSQVSLPSSNLLNGTLLPIQYSLFLLACYGSSINDPDLLDFMVTLLGVTRTQSAAFPLALQFVSVPPAGWRLRFHLADDLFDPGIVIGHDTTVFKQVMIEANSQASQEKLLKPA